MQPFCTKTEILQFTKVYYWYYLYQPTTNLNRSSLLLLTLFLPLRPLRGMFSSTQHFLLINAPFFLWIKKCSNKVPRMSNRNLMRWYHVAESKNIISMGSLFLLIVLLFLKGNLTFNESIQVRDWKRFGDKNISY